MQLKIDTVFKYLRLTKYFSLAHILQGQGALRDYDGAIL